MKLGVAVAVLVLGLVAGPALAAENEFPLPPSDWPQPVHDRPFIPFILGDLLEYRAARGPDARAWDAQAWLGGDFNKLWLKSEGEQGPGARTEQADLELLYARLIAPFWYLQAGAREHFRPSPSRASGVLSVQGIAPYWFDVEASVFVDQKAKVSAPVSLEYDLLFTQGLILQPRFETNLSAMTDEERELGRGFNDIEVGVRLRYEIHRQLAPYVGGNWTRQLGSTADFARQAGGTVSELSAVVGLRIWL